jgi:hypothetical protein
MFGRYLRSGGDVRLFVARQRTCAGLCDSYLGFNQAKLAFQGYGF